MMPKFLATQRAGKHGRLFTVAGHVALAIISFCYAHFITGHVDMGSPLSYTARNHFI